MKLKHNKLGNCWCKAVAFKRGELNDVCNEHDEPRGHCSQCEHCAACAKEDRDESS